MIGEKNRSQEFNRFPHSVPLRIIQMDFVMPSLCKSLRMDVSLPSVWTGSYISVIWRFIRLRFVRSQCWHSSSNNRGPLSGPQIRYDGYIESYCNEIYIVHHFMDNVSKYTGYELDVSATGVHVICRFCRNLFHWSDGLHCCWVFSNQQRYIKQQSISLSGKINTVAYEVTRATFMTVH